MDLFWKAMGGLLIAVVLGLMLNTDISVMLSVAVCTMGAAVAIHYFQPVFLLLKNLHETAAVSSENLQILFRIVGVGVISEIAQMICSDAGSNAMGKIVGILTKAGILWIAIPVFQGILSILRQILEEI